MRGCVLPEREKGQKIASTAPRRSYRISFVGRGKLQEVVLDVLVGVDKSRRGDKLADAVLRRKHRTVRDGALAGR